MSGRVCGSVGVIGFFLLLEKYVHLFLQSDKMGKDKIKYVNRSNAVYHYKSERNPKCKKKDDYIGETKVRLCHRCYEHFVADKKSAIRQHCKKCRHGGEI